MSTTDPTPYTPTNDEVRVLAQWIAQAASDWIDVESDEHEHGLACTNWEAYVGDAHDALVDLDARAPEPRAARAARVRAEAVAPVLALHQPRDEQAISGDCAAEECEHEDECPTIAFAVCAECYRVAEESDPYFGERGLSSVAHPCPTVRAVSIEQETQP